MVDNKSINQKLLKRYYEKQGEMDFNRQLYENPNPYRKWFHIKRKSEVYTLVGRASSKFQPGIDVLDAGCGDGEYTLVMPNFNLFPFGVDISSSFIKRAKKRDRSLWDLGKYQVGSIEHLPFKENKFDIVLCSEALEHVLNYPKALSEICRVSKRYVVISVPIEKTHPFIKLGLRILGKKDMIPSEIHEDAKGFEEIKGGHLREFTPKQINKNLEERGFKIIKRKKIHNSALIALLFILSEKMPLLNKLSGFFIPLIRYIDCLFPWWGLTYIVVAKKCR